MKRHDDYYEEEHGSGSKMIYVYMLLIMSAVIFVVTALVFWVNQSNNGSNGSGYAAAVAQKEAKESDKQTTSQNTGTATSQNKLTSDELDIWTLPDTGREKESSSSTKNNGTVTNQTTGETVVDGTIDSTENAKTAEELAQGKTSTYDMPEKEDVKNTAITDKENTEEKQTEETEEEDEEEEEISILVKHADGTKEWVDINQNITKNDYDFTNLTYQKPLMNYYEEGELVSRCGVDVSAKLGEVDFKKLKNAGCNFVMVRVGARGYSSGNIVMDANYVDNIKAAKNAGLDVGVYFCSQAVTRAEAREEADELLDAISGYRIQYPLVFVMENVDDDMARIEALDITERTQIARAFMDRVADSGYTPMLYGDKEWLLTMVNIEELQEYDIWYAQDGDKPEYPYEFGMWQYDSDATIKGIKGDAAMIISFKDYSKE